MAVPIEYTKVSGSFPISSLCAGDYGLTEELGGQSRGLQAAIYEITLPDSYTDGGLTLEIPGFSAIYAVIPTSLAMKSDRDGSKIVSWNYKTKVLLVSLLDEGTPNAINEEANGANLSSYSFTALVIGVPD